MAFSTSDVILTDGAGYTWDIQRDGSVRDGTNDAFDGGLDHTGIGFGDYLEIDDDGRTIRTDPTLSGGLLSSREVRVSQEHGYARFLDVITNTTDQDIVFTYTLNTDFGSDGSTDFISSNGPGFVNAADWWAGSIDRSTGNSTPVTGVLFSDPRGGGAPGSATGSSDDLSYTQTVSIAAGESVSFLNFGAQAGSARDLRDVFTQLGNLELDALAGLDADEINDIANWRLPSRDLTLTGTRRADELTSSGGDDLLSGLAGNDVLHANGGDDTAIGGLGFDRVYAGDGNDVVYGGLINPIVTTTAETTTATGENIAISLSAPDAAAGPQVNISGFISREPISAATVDVVFAIDVSGSTDDIFQGAIDVGDRNGDGQSNTILDAEIASFEALHRAIVRDARLPDAQVSVVAFESSASALRTYTATQDDNSNGIADVLEYVRGLSSDGGTAFDNPLQSALSYFQGSDAGQQLLYFLSDGENNSFGDFEDEARALRREGVLIESFAVGADASEEQLDLLDDGRVNGSARVVLDPSLLSDEVLSSGIDSTDIARVVVRLNGRVVERIDPEDLTVTPFGLRYFELDVSGLNPRRDDVIEVRVIAADNGSTVLSTRQTVEQIFGVDRADRLFGGDGEDMLFGAAGNDFLMGGAEADILNGQGGRDTAGYGDSAIGVDIALLNGGRSTSGPDGDTLISIENLRGSHFADILTGNGGRNILHGNGGADRLSGRNGNDVLNGAEGNDILRGGNGADRFVFQEGSGLDRIVDFQDRFRQEKIDLSDFDIANLAELRGMMSLNNGNTIINFDTGDRLIIENHRPLQLGNDDFIL